MGRNEFCKQVRQETNNLKNRSTFFYQVREGVREFCILSKYKKTLQVQGVDPQEVVMSKHTL